MKTIGNLTSFRNDELRNSANLYDPSLAYEILDEIMPEGWYPADADEEWTDILVHEGKFYACYGNGSLSAIHGFVDAIEIEPTELMKSEYEYYKQY
jgi:hypothetical protein